METILNSSFDWNGIREPFVVATENDAMNGAPMLFGADFITLACMRASRSAPSACTTSKATRSSAPPTGTPLAWKARGADYRACETLGPLYGKK